MKIEEEILQTMGNIMRLEQQIYNNKNIPKQKIDEAIRESNKMFSNVVDETSAITLNRLVAKELNKLYMKRDNNE